MSGPDSKTSSKTASDDTEQVRGEKKGSRRAMLRSLGYGALAVLGSVGTVPALAQQKLELRKPALKGTGRTVQVGRLKIPQEMLDAQLTRVDRNLLRRLVVPKPLPPSTPITKMYLRPDAVSKLTPAARKLTKQDLVAMQRGKIPPRARNLTVRDIVSIKEAFAVGYAPADVLRGGELAHSCCCCCSPCCCAAAATDISLAA